MKRDVILVIAGVSLALSSTAASAAQSNGGSVGSLPVGQYRCELPGDASGRAGIRQPDRDFRVTGASTYEHGGQRGTYLLRGGRVDMTSGPMRGESFAVMSANQVREIGSNGKPTRLRCIRR